MTNHVLLDNITHKNLRVRHATRRGLRRQRRHGADVCRRNSPTCSANTPSSSAAIPTGDYFSVALLGFAKDENLYLEGDRWDAYYVPGIIARGPFLIGFQERQEGGELRRDPVIHVDMDNPRVNETEASPRSSSAVATARTCSASRACSAASTMALH